MAIYMNGGPCLCCGGRYTLCSDWLIPKHLCLTIEAEGDAAVYDGAKGDAIYPWIFNDWLVYPHSGWPSGSFFHLFWDLHFYCDPTNGWLLPSGWMNICGNTLSLGISNWQHSHILHSRSPWHEEGVVWEANYNIFLTGCTVGYSRIKFILREGTCAELEEGPIFVMGGSAGVDTSFPIDYTYEGGGMLSQVSAYQQPPTLLVDDHIAGGSIARQPIGGVAATSVGLTVIDNGGLLRKISGVMTLEDA